MRAPSSRSPALYVPEKTIRMSDAKDEVWTKQFDQAGTLTIVMHGGVFEDNLVTTANYCEHWRALFPEAEIILSVSVTDILLARVGPDELMSGTRLVPALRHRGILKAALRAILTACNKLVLSPGAVPLPPIKTAPNINNCNLQLAAVISGLRHVNGKYTLRVRSDYIFSNRKFLNYYFSNAFFPRRRASIFTQRVLISELFTLNPYTLERFPLHFSDWFHFGLSNDVAALWDVEPMKLADGIYYKLHPFAPHSNALERHFVTRLAVEQYLTYSALKRHFGELRLEYHNDLTSADLSMDILINNFIIADMEFCGVYIDKYQWNIKADIIPEVCVTSADWRKLAASGQSDYRVFFDKKIKLAQQRLLADAIAADSAARRLAWITPYKRYRKIRRAILNMGFKILAKLERRSERH